MKGRELINEVLKLGLKSQAIYPVEPEAIYAQANRAILEVNRLCPILGTATILHFPISPTVYLKGITVRRGGEDLIVDASGVKSLAFAVSGTGECIISAKGTDHFERIEWRDAIDFKNFGGIIQNMFGLPEADITISFTGAYSYMIKDLSVYSEITSELAIDVVPYGRFVSYDLSSHKYAGERFLDFAALPVRYNDTTLNDGTDYVIDGSKVLIPTDKTGVYQVQYNKRPDTLDKDNVDLEIEIDPRLEDLLALRAAYYFYMVTDREVAERCNNEYLRLYGIVMSTLKKVRSPVKFRERRGWV